MPRSFGTDHPNQIDVLGEQDGMCYLTLIQADEVDSEGLLTLQEKLNHYLAFVLDGQLANEFPELATLPKVISVRFRVAPTDEVSAFLLAARQVCESDGIGLVFDQE